MDTKKVKITQEQLHDIRQMLGLCTILLKAEARDCRNIELDTVAEQWEKDLLEVNRLRGELAGL